MREKEEDSIKTHWRDWLRLRDVYDVGKEHRYTEAQIQYHYTHDKAVLAEALMRQDTI